MKKTDDHSPPLPPEELEQRVQRLMQGETYRLATNDPEFLEHDDLRGVRLQLEYLKPEWTMRHQRIGSSVIVFGSARLRSKDQLDEQHKKLSRQLEKSPGDKALTNRLNRVEKRRKYVRYYEEARRFAALVSKKFQSECRCDLVVITGGGPGIMEAANRGADDVGARSIGLNIDLPREQTPNPYISPELCFQFRYFALRKMHFLMRAKALVAFPGGFGTFDEVFEILTLVQTGKVAPLPIVLFGRQYWSRVVDFEFLAEEGFIGEQDLSLFEIVDSAEQALLCIEKFFEEQ